MSYHVESGQLRYQGQLDALADWLNVIAGDNEQVAATVKTYRETRDRARQLWRASPISTATLLAMSELNDLAQALDVLADLHT